MNDKIYREKTIIVDLLTINDQLY